MNINDRHTVMNTITSSTGYIVNIVFKKANPKCNEFVIKRFLQTVKMCDLMDNVQENNDVVNFMYNSAISGEMPSQVIREIGEVAAYKQTYDQNDEGIILIATELNPSLDHQPVTLQTSYCRKNGSKIFADGEITLYNSDGRTLKLQNEMHISFGSCISVISTVADSEDTSEYSIYQSKGAFHRFLKERVKGLGSDKMIHMLGKFISTPADFLRKFSHEEIQEFCKSLEVIILKGFTDRPVLGHYTVIPSIKLNNKIIIKNPKVIIIPGCANNIIGMDILSKFHIELNANSRNLTLTPRVEWTSYANNQYEFDFEGLSEPLLKSDYIEDDPSFRAQHFYVEEPGSPHALETIETLDGETPEDVNLKKVSQG